MHSFCFLLLVSTAASKPKAESDMMLFPPITLSQKSAISQNEFADHKIKAAQACNLHVKRSMDM